MLACNLSIPCEPYPLLLPLTVIHPRSPCTFAAGVSAILQHTAPVSPPYSYTAEPCIHFTPPVISHGSSTQRRISYFRLTPPQSQTTMHKYHTHSHCENPRHCNIPIFPTLIKWKNTFSRYCTLGNKDFRKIWFIEDITLFCVPVTSISQHRHFHCTLTGLNLQLFLDLCFTLYVYL